MIRRPAAKGKAKAKAAPKAGAKAAPKVRPGGRARGGVLLRPAAVQRRRQGPAGESTAEKFEKGGEVDAGDLPLQCLVKDQVIIAEGSYWSNQCKLAGKIQSVQPLGNLGNEVGLRLEGTDHEELLKWGSANPNMQVRGHLCGQNCQNPLEGEGLVHLQKIRKKKLEGDVGWSENMKPTLDELASIRALGEEEARRKKELEDKEKADREEKKGKRKKEKKKKKESESKSEEEAKEKEKKRKMEPQKDLVAVFGTTGLDPNPKVRKRLRKRVKKRMKKKKKELSSSDGSLSASKSSEVEEVESESSEGLFQDNHKVRSVARRAPGLSQSTSY